MQSQPTIIINNDGGSRSSGGSSIIGGLLPSRIWSIIGIVLIILVAVSLFSTYSFYENYKEENCPDSDGLIDVGFCAIENAGGAEDTGQTATQAFLSTFLWASPIGYIGAAIEVSTEGGSAGERVGNNFSRVRNGVYTIYKRILGR